MPRGSTSSLYKSSYLMKLCDDFGGDAFSHEGLDDVADFNVAVIGDGDAAFHAVANFAGIIFEATQGADLSAEDNYVVAKQADLGIALDNAICNSATSNRADFRNTESLQYVGAALVRFFDRRLEQAAHGAFDLVLQFVDDRVQTDIDFFLLGEFLGFAFRADIETDDDGVGRGGEQNVA